MEVYQDVGAVAVDLLKREFGISGPEIEGLAQFQPYAARAKTARLLGSQTAKTQGINVCVRNRLVRSADRARGEGQASDINREKREYLHKRCRGFDKRRANSARSIARPSHSRHECLPIIDDLVGTRIPFCNTKEVRYFWIVVSSTLRIVRRERN